MEECHMKKILSIVVVIIMLLASGCSFNPDVMGLLGESDPNAEEINNVVLIVDKTRYAPQYDLGALLRDDISKYYCKKKDKVTVICPDGSGNPSSKTFHFEGTNKKVDRNSMKRVIAKEVDKVFSYIEDVKPIEAELSLMPALSLAASELASDEATIGRVYLVTGGLTTVAPLDMKSGLDIDPEQTIRRLRAKDMLPDFQGASIDIYGLGYVAQGTEQKSLGSSEKKLLTSFYEELLKASKAECRIHSNTPDSVSTADRSSTLPYVTPVVISVQDNLITSCRTNVRVFDDAEVQSGESAIDLSKEVLEYPPETLNYKPGSDQFLLSVEEVAGKLTPIWDWYAKNPRQLYIFSGTASFGTEKELMELSKKRGNAVKEILVSLGVDADDIIVIPMGYSKNPYRKTDVVNGVYDEEAAKQNRVTYVMSVDNPAVDDFQDALED